GRHVLHHFGLERPGLGKADIDVGAVHDLGQFGLVRFLGEGAAPAIDIVVARLGDEALAVSDPDVFAGRADGDQHVHAGDGGSTGAGGHDLDLGNVLADQFHGVEDGGSDDDGGAVLVIVEDRDIHALAQGFLDLKTFRGLDVLEIDAAEAGFERSDNVDETL